MDYLCTAIFVMLIFILVIGSTASDVCKALNNITEELREIRSRMK